MLRQDHGGTSPVRVLQFIFALTLGVVNQTDAAAPDPLLSAAAEGTLVTLHIDRQSLPDALSAFAAQTGLQLVYHVEDINSQQIAPAVSGEYTPEAALTKILDTSGLSYHYVNARTVAIRIAQADVPPGTNESSFSAVASDQTSGGSTTQPNIALAREEGDASSGSSHSSLHTKELAEVIVSAEKHSERLQDVPVPVTVLNVESLTQNNQTRLQDYFASVPGLSLGANADGGIGGMQTLAIRGITTGGAGFNPTVAVTVDEVPYGSTSSYGFGNVLYPDIDPADLERIEVLRGPQGTLYGASSIGGLIKFVIADPSTSAFSGHVQVLGEDVEHGEGGYAVRGSVNLPLSDVLAIRASGFARRDPGYVENVTTGQKSVNQADVEGGLLSALWRPSDVFSLKTSALLQNTNSDGSATVDTDSLLHPTLGYFKHANLPGTGEYSIQARLYTATLTARLGTAELTATSGYQTNKYSTIVDFTQGFGGSCAQCYSQSYYGVASASFADDFETRKFTQEVRLASTANRLLEWLVGGFYSHEHSPVEQTNFANETATGARVGTLIGYSEPITIAEYAIFGALTVHFTDRFDIQLGGRESWNRQTYDETDTGPVVLAFDGTASPYVQPTEHLDANAFTYLLTPRFRFSPHIMAYARFASGYRDGSPNYEAQLLHVPAAVAPDKTYNYELGVKGDYLNHALTFDASAYYIDWRQIQVLVLSNIFSPYNTNGGNAKSEGLEVSVQARPTDSLKITAAASLNDAQLTQNFPASAVAVGFAGDRLPYSSRFSGSLSVDQDIVRRASWTAFLGGSLSYVGTREGEFVSNPTQPRPSYPGYAQLDLRAGVRLDSCAINLFVNNVSDRKGVVGGGIGYAEAPYYAVYIQPLTFGLSLTKTF
jgi:iron complex outermembrane recepter protein